MKKNLGARGEALAAKWLEKNKGLRILERNWRQGSFTELDIVALDPTASPETLVVVEVKTRVSTKYGRGITAITQKKLHAIKRSFSYFVKITPGLPKRLRVDAVDILYSTSGYDIKYYRNILGP